MSHELILSILANLALSQEDAQVYIFLAFKIPQKARDIAEALKLKKHRLYPTLRTSGKKASQNAQATALNDFQHCR